MKRFFILFIAILANFFTSYAVTKAYIDGIWYNLDWSTKTATVTYSGSSYTNNPTEYSGAIVIPSSVMYNIEYRVTKIGEDAFRNCTGITSVTIGDKVTRIGRNAFANCTGLNSITLGEKVTVIDFNAFEGCTSLSGTIVLPSTIDSIYPSAFYNCTGLSRIEVPRGPTFIASNAFYNVLNIIDNTNISGNPWGARSEGGYIEGLLVYGSEKKLSLIGCSALLTEVTIPETIYTIGNSVFKDMTQLTSVIISDAVNYIGEGAFSGCSGLTSIHIPEGLEWINNDVFYGCTGLTSINIPNSVTYIGNAAFKNCSGLTSIEIPENVRQIGYSVFDGCNALSRVTWNPHNISWWGDEPFAQTASHITSFTFGSTVDTIPDRMCYKMALTDVTIPSNVKHIGKTAFCQCANLSKIKIENGVQSIGYSAFGTCVNLSEVEIECETPPSYESEIFSISAPYYRFTSIYVPCGKEEVYQQAWSDYADKIKYAPLEYNVDVTMNIPNAGTISKLLERCHSELSVTSNYGYHFTQWSDGKTDNPRTIEVHQDTTFTAEFAKNVYTITAQADGTQGSIVSPSQAEYLDKIQLTAMPNYGFHFTRWSDGNTANPRTIELTKDTTFAAEFSKNVYTITSVYNKNEGYIWKPSQAAYLDTVVLTAEPNEGYHFTQWKDGNTDNPRSFVITQDTTFTAEFAKNVYTITAQADGTQGSIVSPSQAEYQDIIMLTVIPNYGYHFSQWSDGNTDNPRSVKITQDTTFIAEFAKNVYSINYVDNPQGSIIGASEAAYLDTVVLTVTPNYGYYFTQWSDGNIDNPRIILVTQDSTFAAEFETSVYSITTVFNPKEGSVSSPTNATYLQKIKLTATSNYGYHFSQWSDGNTDNPRSVKITQDTTFIAEFAKNVYSINYVDNPQGSIIGASEAAYLDTVVLTAMPKYGCHFTQWSDGNTANPRTFVMMQDTTFAAEFAKNNVVVRYGTNMSNDTIIAYTSVNELTMDDFRHISEFQTATVVVDDIIPALWGWNVHLRLSDGNGIQEKIVIVGRYDYSYIHAVVNGGSKTQKNGIGSLYEAVVTAKTSELDFEADDAGYVGYKLSTDGQFISLTLSSEKFYKGDIVNIYTTKESSKTINLYSGSNASYLIVSLPKNNKPGLHTYMLGENANGVKELSIYRTDSYMNPYIAYVEVVREKHFQCVTQCDKQHGSISSTDSIGTLMQPITLTAVPNVGYYFIRWNDGNTDNPRTIVMKQDTAFTAEFSNIYTITDGSNPEQGTISGVSQAAYLDTVVLTAEPNDGYYFTQWSDGNTDNPRSFVMTQDTTFTAVFEPITTYSVTAYAENAKVFGSGEYSIGTTISLSVQPYKGYEFFMWEDGNTDNPRTMVVLSETELMAYCKEAEKEDNVATLPYNEPFTENIGQFHISDIILYGVSYVWKWASANYGMKATAYYNNSGHNTESWLISPYISLKNMHDIKMSFSHAVNKGTIDDLKVKISKDEGLSWKELTIPNWPAGTNWNFVSTSLSLDEYENQIIQIAFVYVSTISNSPTWEIKNFSITGEDAGLDNPIHVSTSETTVTITWNPEIDAYTYELIILDAQGNVIYSFIFDTNGQLISTISYSPRRNKQEEKSTLSYVVQYLNAGTDYSYMFLPKNAQGDIICTEYGTFKTEGISTHLFENVTPQSSAVKILHNCQIFILRGDKTYTITGQEVK